MFKILYEECGIWIYRVDLQLKFNKSLSGSQQSNGSESITVKVMKEKQLLKWELKRVNERLGEKGFGNIEINVIFNYIFRFL